jgi:lipopolysaccharide/colanic/teichoic acid biosynthesis glycosyltransferase
MLGSESPVIPRSNERTCRASVGSQGYCRWKARLDAVLTVVLLIPATPLVVLAALLVRLTSRGPIFYSQKRLGWGGTPFTLYKIRTMYHDCERESGVVWSPTGDPRITPLGHILRATHIDELPQLINILRGEMSLIGPRPERPEIITQLERIYPGYRDRLSLRPGISGLAQVQLPPDLEIAGIGRKLSYDLYYVKNLNLQLDLRILAGTVLTLIGVPFSLIRSLLGFPVCGGWGDPGSEPKRCPVARAESHPSIEIASGSRLVSTQPTLS